MAMLLEVFFCREHPHFFQGGESYILKNMFTDIHTQKCYINVYVNHKYSTQKKCIQLLSFLILPFC